MKRFLFVLVPLVVLLSSPFVRAEEETPVVASVEIQAIEGSRDDINRLVPNTTYVINGELLQQLQKLISLKQAVILSQARIATVSGQVAQVKSVRELIYSSEYDTGTARSDNNRGSNITIQVTQNATNVILYPSSFKTRELGTILNVTPTVGVDRKTINLALTPEVSLLSKLGYSKASALTPAGKTEVSQPDIYCWIVATTVILRTGSTAVLAVLEPLEKDPSSGKDNVVLVLVTASVNSVK